MNLFFWLFFFQIIFAPLITRWRRRLTLMGPEERCIFEMRHLRTQSAACGSSVPEGKRREASAVLSSTAYLQHLQGCLKSLQL